MICIFIRGCEAVLIVLHAAFYYIFFIQRKILSVFRHLKRMILLSRRRCSPSFKWAAGQELCISNLFSFQASFRVTKVTVIVVVSATYWLWSLFYDNIKRESLGWRKFWVGEGFSHFLLSAQADLLQRCSRLQTSECVGLSFVNFCS